MPPPGPLSSPGHSDSRPFGPEIVVPPDIGAEDEGGVLDCGAHAG